MLRLRSCGAATSNTEQCLFQRRLYALKNSTISYTVHCGVSPRVGCSEARSSCGFAAQQQLKGRLKKSSTKVAALPVLGDVAEGLETPVQLLYIGTLLGFLVVGAYLVVRQVLIRRELEEAAKILGERIRSGGATAEDCFELGVILLRKKLYTQATKNLDRAKRNWDGNPEELAQVHNALGFAYFNMDKLAPAISEYLKAVELQPGYVTAWNNLGDAYEKGNELRKALEAYENALRYAPENKVAASRTEYLRTRVQRLGL